MTKQEAIQTLECFKALPPNWNQYNALPLTPSFIDSFIKWINRLQDPFFQDLHIYPLPTDGIQLEYEPSSYYNGAEHLELTIYNNEPKCSGCYITYIDEEGIQFRNEYMFSIKNDFTAIKRCINKFKTGGFKKEQQT